MNHMLSRRLLLRRAGAGAIAAAMARSPFMLPLSASAHDGGPHFFLHVCVSGGLDASYLFDARPLSFTDRNLIQNYLYKNSLNGSLVLPDPAPRPYVGRNGGRLLRTPLTEILMKHAERFTVVNGVQMLTNGFNSHGANMYYLFSNSSTEGGRSFLPFLGARSGAPLESVHCGGFEGDGNRGPTNFALSLKVDNLQSAGLGSALGVGQDYDPKDPAHQFLRARTSALAKGDGLFSSGTRRMQAALDKVQTLTRALKGLDGSRNDPLEEPEIVNLLSILGLFSGKVTSAATLMLDRDPVLDTHSPAQASLQGRLIGQVSQTLSRMFDILAALPFDEARGLSFFDVTTVLVSTEFSRTMKQMGEGGDTVAVDRCGTDHNPFTNTLLLAGKGIAGGNVIGASDLSALDGAGAFSDVSPAHRQRDPALISSFGRPFDPATGTVRARLPPAIPGAVTREPQDAGGQLAFGSRPVCL